MHRDTSHFYKDGIKIRKNEISPSRISFLVKEKIGSLLPYVQKVEYKIAG